MRTIGIVTVVVSCGMHGPGLQKGHTLHLPALCAGEPATCTHVPSGRAFRPRLHRELRTPAHLTGRLGARLAAAANPDKLARRPEEGQSRTPRPPPSRHLASGRRRHHLRSGCRRC